MSDSNFLFLPPNPSPTIETPTISPPPPQTGVNQAAPPPPVANQATSPPQTGVNQATPPPPTANKATPSSQTGVNQATSPPPFANQATLPPQTGINQAPPPPQTGVILAPPPPQTGVNNAPPPPQTGDNQTTLPPQTGVNQATPPRRTGVNQALPPPSIGNQAYPPPLVANQAPPPPSIANQATSPPLVANHAPPRPSIANHAPPPPSIANHAPPPPSIANQAPPPPSIANQAFPPPLISSQGPPPPFIANQGPPSPSIVNQGPPSPSIANQATPPSHDATQLTPPASSVHQLAPPPLNAKQLEPELTENKKTPNPFLSNLISSNIKSPPPLAPPNTSPSSPNTALVPILAPPPPPVNPVSVSVQIPPPDSVQQRPPLIFTPSITTFQPLPQSTPSPPPPVDPLLTLVPPGVPVDMQVQFPPPPPPEFSNPVRSPLRNPADTSSAPHVHIHPFTTEDSSTSVPKHDTLQSTVTIVGITLMASFILFFLMYLFITRVKSLRRNRRTKFLSLFKTNKNNGGQVSSTSLNSSGGFSYKQLYDMTLGFSDDNIIGEGGYAHVYKGLFPNGTEVAVKRIKKEKATAQELRLEMEIIGRIHHRHLVKFLGYCLTEAHQLLVYEFVPNRTLSYHLHEEGLPVLDWQKRIKIAIGSARCLKYLHEDCEPKIVHRDIKSANILLDNSFEPKIADFGLAKLRHDDNTHVSTRVMGTYGYLAPEYATTGQLTFKSDVFSFGVVLLELITGRRAINPLDPEESLVGWAWPLLVEAIKTENFEALVDPKLEGNYDEREMCQMVNVAAGCVRHSVANRPSMPQVLKALESGCNLSDLCNGVRFGDSTTFDSRQYSLEIESFQNREFGVASVRITNS